MPMRFTRRKFLTSLGSILGGLSLAEFVQKISKAQAPAPPYPPRQYFPLVGHNISGPLPLIPPGIARVVHVRHGSATSPWGLNPSDYYYNHVDQAAVDSMVASGLQRLTGRSTWGEIWGQLFGRVRSDGYLPGRKIAIKVNFNNNNIRRPQPNTGCNFQNNEIDALPQPVIGLLNGLKAAGVNPDDVWVYDVTPGGFLPAYFRTPIHSAFPGVHFLDAGNCSGFGEPGFGKHSSLTVHFSPLAGRVTNRLVANLLYDAAFLINMPILKGHSGDNAIPFTAGFKNHLGSINIVYKTAVDNLHPYLKPRDPLYMHDYSPLVEVYKNLHIANKTILTVCDGLFGAKDALAQSFWAFFNNQPANSLLFSADPVALDCVAADILRAEGWISNPADYDYLFLAQSSGLGKCEGSRDTSPGGNPRLGSSGYTTLDYQRIDI